MAFALVYTGEHYVLDIAAGIGYAIAVHLLASRWWHTGERGSAVS